MANIDMWRGLVPAGGALAGGIWDTSAQNSQNNTAMDLARSASQFGPFGASGFGGIGGTYANSNTNLNLGALTDPYGQFAGLASSQLGLARGVNGLPSNVADANFLTPGINSAFGAASGQLGPNSPAMGTANTAFLGAGQQALAAGQDPTGYANSVYQNLTQQAAPWETKQYNDLMDSQFGSGRLGSSGGALQTQAFAQGLGTANLQRQLQAQTLAQSNQNNAAQRAGALGGLGNALLSNAFGNFSNISGLGINNLGAQSSLSFLPANLTGAYLGNAGSAVTGANNAQQSALNVFNAGMGAQTQNSAALARGGELGYLNANGQNTAGSPWGQLLQGLFGGALNSQGGGNSSGNGILSKLLGGNNNNGSNLLQQLFGGTGAGGAGLGSMGTGSGIGALLGAGGGDAAATGLAGGAADAALTGAGVGAGTDVGGFGMLQGLGTGGYGGATDLASLGGSFGSAGGQAAAAGASGAGAGAAGVGATAGAGAAASGAGGFATGGAASAAPASGAAAFGPAAGLVAAPAILDTLLRKFTGIDSPSLSSNLLHNFLGASTAGSGSVEQYKGQLAGPPSGVTYKVTYPQSAYGGGMGAAVGASSPQWAFTGPNGKPMDSSFDMSKASQLYNAAYLDSKLASAANVKAYQDYIKQHGG